ncbi:hypothetical protein CDD80_1344 [Ophiocordyceps camponoti-rufipedis]|uniref:MACPF domain-containing protein n=1 Tax=Ophiocordyceps camponoti-rufipedis TaxID=2004952 RepID=A0A2C5Z9G5_9HYPO|nr:hypothetical protein CDD80_1344 [Ophiocordyceps camponoti-rufipedis]
MGYIHTACSWAVVIAPAVFPRLSFAELVPFTDSLTEGQGYNTFLRSGCTHKAVISKDESSPVDDGGYDVTYMAEKMESYHQFLSSIDVNIAASMGVADATDAASGSFSASFLNQHEFQSSFLTYLVKVDVRRQPTGKKEFRFNPSAIPVSPEDIHSTYWFVAGGALFARVSIMVENQAKHTEVAQSAEAAFKMYGSEVRVSESIYRSITDIHRNSQVRVYLHYVGAPPEAREGTTEANDEGSMSAGKEDLLHLKDLADEFLANAKKHNWKRLAILDRYTNVPEFDKVFRGVKPLDYARAIDRSKDIFDDFTTYTGLQLMIRGIDIKHYLDGREARETLDNRCGENVQKFRDWFQNVTKDPDKSKTKPSVDNPDSFLAEIVQAVRSTVYIAQRLKLANGETTDIFDTKLRWGATERFRIRAYDFGDVQGTKRISFGRKTEEDEIKCEIVKDRDLTVGYELESRFWAFDSWIAGLDLAIDILVIPSESIVDLNFHNASQDVGSRERRDQLHVVRRSRIRRRQFALRPFTLYGKPV